MKKTIKNLLFGLTASTAVVTPIIATMPSSQQIITSSTKSESTGLKVSYELGEYKEHGIYCSNERKEWDFLYWNDIGRMWPGNESKDGIYKPFWCDPKDDKPESPRFKFATCGRNNNDRFVYQPVKVNVTVPAHTTNYKVDFYANFYHWADSDYAYDTEYFSNVQLFNFEDDAAAHPDRFNNLTHNRNNIDPYSVYEGVMNKIHGAYVRLNPIDFTYDKDFDNIIPKNTKISRKYVGNGNPTQYSLVGGSDHKSIEYDSNHITWTFSNDTDSDISVSKYIGFSWWLVGISDYNNGDVESDIKIQLNASLAK